MEVFAKGEAKSDFAGMVASCILFGVFVDGKGRFTPFLGAAFLTLQLFVSTCWDDLTLWSKRVLILLRDGLTALFAFFTSPLVFAMGSLLAFWSVLCLLAAKLRD